MKIFSATYTDFIKFDRKPNEDFYLISEKFPIFVVADGVTRGHFPTGEYAFPAGAKSAVQIFCYSVLEFLENNWGKKKPKVLIKEAFDFANQKIRTLNFIEEIDKRLNYFEYDWFCCVGVAGFIVKNLLYFGYVGDCGVAILDRKNKLKFQTKDMVAPAVKRAERLLKNWESLSQRERTIILRRDFRNRKDGKGFGAFTGEEGVKKYYRIGKKKIKAGDLIVFYSDGFLNYFQFPEFIEILRKGEKKLLDDFSLQKAKESYEKYGTDRTLIAVKI